MKRLSYIAISAAAALAFCGCQTEPLAGLENGSLAFAPSISGTETKELTKAGSFTSADGTEIPVWIEVSDGINGGITDNKCEIPTKGDLMNETGSNKPLANYVSEFYVKGWKGTEPFLHSSGSHYTVSYSYGAWSTVSNLGWSDSDSRTFYAYANLPASGASVTNSDNTGQTLTYSAVPADAASQNDILLGYGNGNGTLNSTARTSTADLVFYHPLAAVKFVFGQFDGVSSIAFKAIYINDIYKSGKTTLNPTDIVETDSGDKFEWTDRSTEMQEASQVFSPALSGLSNGDVIGKPFIVIPQEFSTDKPVTLTLVVAVTVEGETSDKAFTLTLTSGAWKAGKTYTYKVERKDSSSS